MKYEEALKVGRRRAELAAAKLEAMARVEAFALCAVKPGSRQGDWQPVGEKSWVEIAADDGYRGEGDYSLLVVDKTGAAKACSRKRFSLEDVLKLAEMLKLPEFAPGSGELSKALEQRRVWTAVPACLRRHR